MGETKGLKDQKPKAVGPKEDSSLKKIQKLKPGKCCMHRKCGFTCENLSSVLLFLKDINHRPILQFMISNSIKMRTNCHDQSNVYKIELVEVSHSNLLNSLTNTTPERNVFF